MIQVISHWDWWIKEEEDGQFRWDHIVCADGLLSDSISLHGELIRMEIVAGRDSMLPVKITNISGRQSSLCILA